MAVRQFISVEGVRDATRTLGDGHPLAAAERSIVVLKQQAVVCLGLLLGAPATAVAMDRASATALFVAAAIVEAGLCGGIALMRIARRGRIHDLIVAGTTPDLGVVRDEIRHLRSEGHRLMLASSIERALADGERWHEFMPAARPPHGVRNLPVHADAVHDIARGLRGESASARAIVLVERLATGGYGSALYGADRIWLGRELTRIRYELQTGSSAVPRLRDAA